MIKKKKLSDIILSLKKFLFKNKIPKDYLSKEILKIKKMDSMMIFKLIVFLESKYKIRINDSELFSDKFRNINNISKLVEKKINAIKKK